MEINKKYFNEMFLNIDKNIVLDNDQIKIITDDSKSLIVIAGAGSGKTTTMAAKVKYLVDYNKYKNKEILIISYTNKAVSEISDYVNNKFNLNIDVMTFHKFCLNILRENNIDVKIIKSDFKLNLIKKYVKEDKESKDIYKSLLKLDKSNIFIDKDENFISKLAYFCCDCLDFIKTKGINIDNVDNFFNSTKFSNYYKFITFFKKIFVKYSLYCKQNNLYDFDDLIINSLEYININNIRYRYLIIDEYQDISKIRYDVIKKMYKFCNLTVVGDDWQSIYSFSGSDISYFLNFKKDMNAKILKIENTYRNSYNLIKIAGNFVMKDNNLIKKNLKSNKNLINPIEYIYYRNDINNALEKIIRNIIKNYGIEKKILILGRYKNDINFINVEKINSKFEIKNNKIVYIPNKLIKIYFMTIHASKGLGFDNVILINVLKKDYGFPTLIEDNFFKKCINDFSDNIYEERRLLYVALTRTKNKIYIICPHKKKNRSIFIDELKKGG